jgi:predicted secreted Zn-dependent protease
MAVEAMRRVWSAPLPNKEVDMRPISLAMLAVACLLSGVGGACAGTKLTVHMRTYDVAGKTGAELVDAMDGLGPRHGYTTRAIAETGYAVHWDLDVARDKGACRLRRANGTIDLTYTFPRRTSAVNPSLRKRWELFMAGVRNHEHTHGRIAMRMMRATETALAGLERPGDWFCSGLRWEARRKIDAIYAEYEAKQNAFDAREHRDGGHVEHLVDALRGKD